MAEGVLVPVIGQEIHKQSTTTTTGFSIAERCER